MEGRPDKPSRNGGPHGGEARKGGFEVGASRLKKKIQANRGFNLKPNAGRRVLSNQSIHQ